MQKHAFIKDSLTMAIIQIDGCPDLCASSIISGIAFINVGTPSPTTVPYSDNNPLRKEIAGQPFIEISNIK